MALLITWAIIWLAVILVAVRARRKQRTWDALRYPYRKHLTPLNKGP